MRSKMVKIDGFQGQKIVKLLLNVNILVSNDQYLL